MTSAFVEEWGALASTSASEIEAGTYTASSAAEDAAAGVTLVAGAAWSWAAVTLQAVGGRSGGDIGQVPRAQAHKFKAPAGAKLTLRRGFPTMGPGLDILPGVTIEPEQLGAGETEFTVQTGRGICKGGTYVVEIEAAVDGRKPALMVVWITVL